MDQQAREQAFMSALATEHFVLQAARSAIVGEQVGRVTIYIGAVSGALIAFGFLAQVADRSLVAGPVQGHAPAIGLPRCVPQRN